LSSRVKKAERLEWILKKLEMRGTVSVSELSRELETSVVTIRKDLEILEKERKIDRISGGAVLHRDDEVKKLIPYGPGVKNVTLKEEAAKKAAEFIEDGDSLVVTSGLTTHLTLRCAGRCENLKIVTDSLMIAEEMCGRADYQVVILGGEIDETDYFVHGPDAVRQVNYYMADKAIVTMDGVDADAGLTTRRIEGNEMLRSVLRRARVRILVADSSKIGVKSDCLVDDLSCVDMLVTNWTADPDIRKELKKISDQGIRIVYADKRNKEKDGE